MMKLNVSTSTTLLTVAALSFTSSQALAVDPTDHLGWAQLLVDNISPANNTYDSSPTTVEWAGYNGASTTENRSKCSPFLTHVFDQSYDVTFSTWMGCNSPIAMTWHDQIEAENNFERITQVTEIQAGDIIAIAYDDAGCTNITCSSFSTCSSSGHVMIVKSAPTLRTATSPIVSGTTQYAVWVIDSSASYHGSSDSRYQAEAGGAHDSGAGEGIFRLYADANGEIEGYSWSTFSNSAHYSQSSRHLVVGRYTP